MIMIILMTALLTALFLSILSMATCYPGDRADKVVSILVAMIFIIGVAVLIAAAGLSYGEYNKEQKELRDPSILEIEGELF